MIAHNLFCEPNTQSLADLRFPINVLKTTQLYFLVDVLRSQALELLKSSENAKRTNLCRGPHLQSQTSVYMFFFFECGYLLDNRNFGNSHINANASGIRHFHAIQCVVFACVISDSGTAPGQVVFIIPSGYMLHKDKNQNIPVQEHLRRY